MDLIRFNNKEYPKFQSLGNAAQFAIPYAKHVCVGDGLDIGYGKPEWKFPGAFGVDINDRNEYSATSLPDKLVDYIFSSHLLEHLDNWVDVLDYWSSKIKSGGVLFLYLPCYSQEYWRPWNNRKHKNIFTQEIVRDYMSSNGYSNIYYSGEDLNNSFMIFGEKR